VSRARREGGDGAQYEGAGQTISIFGISYATLAAILYTML
jgi:hypothetical protein